MITQIARFHFFYPMLFTTFIIAILAICSVIKSRNGNMTFKDMFSLSSNNAKEITIDTTDKMKDMHTEVIKVLPETYEHELHKLNTDVKSNTDKITRVEALAQELNDKFDLLLQRVIELEKNK